MILLVMQTRKNALRVRMTKRGRLTTLDSDVPGTIPVANEAARIAAELVGGDAGSSINEVVLGTPTTAHILGGACVGSVVDRYHRVLDAPGVHVVDGAAVNANLGVNPSLSIDGAGRAGVLVLAEQGRRGSAPPLGSPYEPIEAVTPTRPAVPAERVRSAARLGGGALDGLLVEDPGAGRADLLLDLVRDARPLHEHVDALGDVLVDVRGLPHGHRVLTVVGNPGLNRPNG